MATPLQTQIATDATTPQSGTTDGVTIQQRPLADLIAADKHLAGNAAANQAGNPATGNGRRGLVFTKFRRGGTQ